MFTVKVKLCSSFTFFLLTSDNYLFKLHTLTLDVVKSYTTGFIQKNPFKIHKPFHKRKTQHDATNMAQKSSTKVHNSSTHLVKGHNH